MKAKRLTPIAVSSKETILVCDEEDEEQGKNDLSVIENAAAIRIQAAFRGHLVSLFDQVLNIFPSCFLYFSHYSSATESDKFAKWKLN